MQNRKDLFLFNRPARLIHACARPFLCCVAATLLFSLFSACARRPADTGSRTESSGNKMGATGKRMGSSGGKTGLTESRTEANGGRIEWMNLQQAAASLEKEKRPVLIDLYTDWCGWCKQMDRKTYSNRQVQQYVREKFYPVKLDAEGRGDLSWNGRVYSFDPGSRTNAFAVYLTHGRLEFPTTIIIPPGEEPQAIPGYMEPAEIELLLKYFGEGNYHKISFEDYQKGFKASW